MKTLFALILLLATSARAQNREEIIGAYAVAFYVPDSASSVKYNVPYPNMTNEIVVGGRQLPNRTITDCMAFVSNSEVAPEEMLKLANSLVVKEGIDLEQTLQPTTTKTGTVIYQMPNPGAAYMTYLSLQTIDGNSFHENMKRVLGEKAVNLRLEYRRNCRDVR
jgi:hypothetical protein